MKTMRIVSVAGAVILITGIFLGPTFLSRAQVQSVSGSYALPVGQQDSVVRIVAEEEGLSLVPPDQIPACGTFWIVSGNQLLPPFPVLPPEYDPASTPVFLLGPDEQFLVDGTGGAVPQPTGQQAALGVTSSTLAQMQMDAMLNLITQVETVQAARQIQAMGLEPPGSDEEDGTNGCYSSYTPFVFTTNDLWLEITAFTNYAAALVIHRPWNDTNVSHDLFYTTNIAPPVNWQFLMRCVYTNVVVPDLCSPTGFFRLGPATNGNLTVSPNSTAQQLAQLLVPPWMTVTNATYTGANVARGTFAGGNGCGLPIDSGVILATGYITNAIGPNNDDGSWAAWHGSDLETAGDMNLDALTGGGPTYDAAVLEFDIVSSNSFVLQFQYVFASEEYPEYIGHYNDPMAIFVSTNRVGTNWINSITNDLALVPGTTNVPVTVSTVNGGCVNDVYSRYDSPTNAQYYVDNHDPYWATVPPYAVAAPVFNVQYDGMTVLLCAQTRISANITNHVKIAIADYGDPIFDAAVFLKAWSSRSSCQCY